MKKEKIQVRTTTLLDKVGIKTNGLSSVHVLFVINVCPNFFDSLIRSL